MCDARFVADLTLYDYWFSGNGWKVRTLFRHLGRAFTIQWVDILGGEQHEPWFRAKNPVGQIPVLEDASGRVWTESNAILETLSEGTALLPGGHERHQVRAWLNFEQTWIDGVISRARFRRMFPAVIPTPESLFTAWQAEGERALETLNTHLGSTPYMVSARFSIADIGLYAYVHVAEEAGFRLAKYAALRAWVERVADQRGILPIGMNPEARFMPTRCSGTSVTLQPVRDEDIEQLVGLRIEAMRESLERIGRFDATRARQRFVDGFVAAFTRHILVEGERVGFVVVKPTSEGLNLEHLYVRPQYQGRGIGTVVLGMLFEEADSKTLSVRVGALRGSDSNRFYLRHGFVRVEEGEWDIYYLRAARPLKAEPGSELDGL